MAGKQGARQRLGREVEKKPVRGSPHLVDIKVNEIICGRQTYISSFLIQSCTMGRDSLQLGALYFEGFLNEDNHSSTRSMGWGLLVCVYMSNEALFRLFPECLPLTAAPLGPFACPFQALSACAFVRVCIVMCGCLGQKQELITAEITVNKVDQKQLFVKKILGKALGYQI